MVAHFTINTNYYVLKALTNKSVLEGRLARWAEFQMGYDVNIVNCRGKDNIIANTLSRSTISQEWKKMDTATKSNLITVWLLFKISIPAERWEILLRVAHRTETGHLKFNKLLQLLNLRYFWSSMAKEVREFMDRCDVCSRISPFINFQPLKPVETHYLFELVSYDTAHVTMPSGNKKYIVVAIDHYTR